MRIFTSDNFFFSMDTNFNKDNPHKIVIRNLKKNYTSKTNDRNKIIFITFIPSKLYNTYQQITELIM